MKQITKLQIELFIAVIELVGHLSGIVIATILLYLLFSGDVTFTITVRE